MLLIKDSLIDGAGKGLFTTEPIKKGEIVVEYGGERLTWKEKTMRSLKKEDTSYLFHSEEDDVCVDAKHTLDMIGRYANDSNGKIKKEGVINNCVYNVINDKVWIVATTDILANSEIYVSYGDSYWNESPKESVS